MAKFRATVWTLSAAAECVDGWEGLRRNVVELDGVESARDFEATIRDWYISDVDNGVWFGPISRKGR
jgi:hypothetical protein